MPRPRIALVSPAARTAATAELVLADVADPPECRLEKGLYGADPEEVLAFVRDLPDDVDAAMVVGHNPTAHALSQGLLSPATRRASRPRCGPAFPRARSASTRSTSTTGPTWTARSAKLVAIMAPPY